MDAVKTHGMSVVEDMVLRHDDPPMNWVVDATDVHADSGRPPEVSLRGGVTHVEGAPGGHHSNTGGVQRHRWQADSGNNRLFTAI